MGKVIFDISLSLDGFMTAANRRPAEPMGDGGERLQRVGIRKRRARSRDPHRRAGQSRRGDRRAPHLGRLPVLFGRGTRMFEGLGAAQNGLEPLATIQTPRATHLRLRVSQ